MFACFAACLPFRIVLIICIKIPSSPVALFYVCIIFLSLYNSRYVLVFYICVVFSRTSSYALLAGLMSNNKNLITCLLTYL